MMMSELIYNVSKINFLEQKVRFSSCPVHISILYNERVDVLAKEAASYGDIRDNPITIREVISSLQSEYIKISNLVDSGNDRVLVGGYFLNNFAEIKFEFIRRISRKKGDCRSLVRLVTQKLCKIFLHKSLFI